MRLINQVGKRFGRLVVLRRAPNKGPSTYWYCRCDCGKEKAVPAPNLPIGMTTSCGCFRKETNTKRLTKHGLSNTYFHDIYYGLRRRCLSKKAFGYCWYGGRGIKCEWASFEEFRKDMYKGYLAHVKKFGRKNTSIDRINNDGNYCKENCRWTTWKEQARDKIRDANGKFTSTKR